MLKYAISFSQRLLHARITRSDESRDQRRSPDVVTMRCRMPVPLCAIWRLARYIRCVPEGLNSLRAETIPGDTFVDRVYVNGLRRRLGAELQWRPGPLSVQGEVIRVSEERRGQGIDNENLPDAVQRGWYLSGSWLITGEEKKDNVDPAAPFPGGSAVRDRRRLKASLLGGPLNGRRKPDRVRVDFRTKDTPGLG